MTCCFCTQTDDLAKCGYAQCRNYVCPRHGLRYEISDASGMRMEVFCSRACYVRTVRRVMPLQQELLIALIVILIAAMVYLVLLRAATQNL